MCCQSMNMEEDGMKSRSFRYEDYSTRRVFLRSYPLHWGGEDEGNKEDNIGVTNRGSGIKPMKKIILSFCHWGEERALVLRRFKHKVTFYVIACLPVGFKPTTALISA
ncbi:unnamed protein product [Ilex paraguariensis]|uniref:Uncharacterized protein n=1 Tax=Ilex paraguariensis TaxID=185542 RepID=A0ABC8QXW6_9AQUA